MTRIFTALVWGFTIGGFASLGLVYYAAIP